MIDELKKYIPKYKKGLHTFPSNFFDLMGEAIERSERIQAFHLTSGTTSPSTRIHELIKYLKDINT